jgi:hypothetical protein
MSSQSVSILSCSGIFSICHVMLSQFNFVTLLFFILMFVGVFSRFDGIFNFAFIVTHSGFSIHDGTLFHSRCQYTTVKTQPATLGTHVHVRPARSRNTHSYRILPTGPLVAIFQHSFQFLQSESFQTHVGTIHRRAIGPTAHHNSTSAYSLSLTCHLPAPTIGCLHSNDSLTTLTSSFQVPYLWKFTNFQPVTIDTPVHCCERYNAACLHC